MPVVFGAQESVEKLSIERVADQAMSALKLVRLTSDTNVNLADSTLTYDDSVVVGVLLDTAVSAGQLVNVQTYGVLQDALFTFPLNDTLFLGSSGQITNVPPSSGFSLIIGKSLGVGSIFIKIEVPIEVV